jgi:rare lipoprotein A
MPRIFLLGLGAALLLSCGHGNDRPAPRFSAPAVTSAEPGRGGELGPLVGSSQDAQRKPDQIGLATWYGQSFAGRKTASGERFDPSAMTAAHRKLPFNTWVEVKRVDTGSVVRVRITDRGPWGDDRKIIDLSHAAADKLGIVAMGAARVELRIVSGGE